MHLLLTEDDAMLGQSLCEVLRREAYTVDWATDGLAAQAILESGHIDIVVLDLGLPMLGGLDLLRWLRGRGDATPALILTARDQVADRVSGLGSGADDYLVKPFDLDELLARLRVLGRRLAGRTDPCIRHMGVLLNPVSREVSFNDTPVSLTRREYALLLALLERPGRLWSRDELAGRLYAGGVEVHSNAIEVHVHGLRKKLAATGPPRADSPSSGLRPSLRGTGVPVSASRCATRIVGSALAGHGRVRRGLGASGPCVQASWPHA